MLGLTVFVDPVNITDELSKLPLISPVNLSSQQMHALWHLTIDMGMMTRLSDSSQVCMPFLSPFVLFSRNGRACTTFTQFIKNDYEDKS
jgi:hypothetical protein